MKQDGEHPPSDAAREKTRAFIGDVRAARIILDRNTTYALGGLRIEIHGDGTAHFHRQPFFQNEKEHRHTAKLDAKPIFDAFVAEAFTEMVIAPHVGVPDELFVSITLEGAGGRHERGNFIRAPHERFARLIHLVREKAAEVMDQAIRERLTL